MEDKTTPPPKFKRRARWPYYLAAAAILALISIKWLLPIIMEQRAIAAIRVECPNVDVNPPFWRPPMAPIITLIGPPTRWPIRTQLKTAYFGPANLQQWTGHEFLKVISINGNATALRPAASQLRWLRNVNEVVLDGAADEDLAYIGRFPVLETLDLGDGQAITDAGLVHLSGLSQLRTLNLEKTGMTDAGLNHLLPLTSLEDLDLSETQVTLDGLRQLRGCPNLRRLQLRDLGFTQAQCDDLERDLPGCEVTRN